MIGEILGTCLWSIFGPPPPQARMPRQESAAELFAMQRAATEAVSAKAALLQVRAARLKSQLEDGEELVHNMTLDKFFAVRPGYRGRELAE